MVTLNEWDNELDSMDWTHNGVACHIERLSGTGHLCGYVEIAKSHPLYKKDYTEVSFGVHGGLTYARPAYWVSGETAKGLDWWLGFDCGHHGDYAPADAKRWGTQPNEFQPYRNMAYVKAECEQLADQIVAYVAKT